MYKCFIPVFNRLTYTRRMVEYLWRYAEPVVVDNNSDYEPLLEWYLTGPCEVIYLSENYGSRVLWTTDILEKHCPEGYYLVTDPDLDMEGVPDDWLLEFEVGLEKFPQATKAGIALRIDDLPDNELSSEVKGWEASHWAYPLDGGRFYKASILSTLCLCRTRVHSFDAVRTAPPYIAKHIPWYYQFVEDIPEDELYYMQRVQKGFANYWTSRIAASLL